MLPKISLEAYKKLKLEAEQNICAKNVFESFSKRERSRSVVQVTSLYQSMKKQGYSHKKRDYAEVLELLNGLGLGRLVLTKTGKVKGLVDIIVPLQAIGKAALTSNYQSGYVETIFPTRINSKRKSILATPVKPTIVDKPGLTVNLDIELNGIMLKIPVPKDLSSDDLAKLITRLKSA